MRFSVYRIEKITQQGEITLPLVRNHSPYSLIFAHLLSRFFFTFNLEIKSFGERTAQELQPLCCTCGITFYCSSNYVFHHLVHQILVLFSISSKFIMCSYCSMFFQYKHFLILCFLSRFLPNLLDRGY